MTSLASGDIVAKRYRIERELARGGMGVVYVAEHLETEQKIALKLLLSDVLRSPEALERFRLEARVFARLASDHIVRVLDAGIDDARALGFIAMELLEGETLQARIARAGPLDAAALVALFVQVASALDRAHAYVDRDGTARPIVHRDLKPENIFLTTRADGRVHAKVLDFGIAKVASATADVSTDLRGTPQYMALEQVEGTTVTPATDVAALGLIAFYCATGKPYWRSANEPGALLVTVVREIAMGPASAASARARDLGIAIELPSAFDAWFARALARDPTERFASAGDAALALSDAYGIAATLPARTPSRISRDTDAGAEERGLPSATTVHAERRWRGAPWVAGLTALFVAAVAWWVSRSTTGAHAPNTVASSSMQPPRQGIAITDHAPPSTNRPDAAAAYASALLDIRHGAIELAGNDLARAAKLDPTLAAANLRLAVYVFDLTPTQAREALASATRFQASLEARDRALLGIAQASDADPPRPAEAAERARAAVVQFPEDAEVAFVAGTTYPGANRLADALAAYRRALELDPEYASTLAALAYWDYAMQAFDQGMTDVDRCFALSPSASSCLLRRAYIHEARGDCAALESDARLLTQMEPSLPRAHEYLARALAARGAPIESVRAALDRMVDLGELVSPNYSRAVERYWLALLVGDLPAAMAALREGEHDLAGHTDETTHADVAGSLGYLAAEAGDETGARRIREEFQRRAAAWTQDAPWQFRLEHLVDLHHDGHLDDAQFTLQRDDLYRADTARAPKPDGSIDADWIWTRYYVRASTPWDLADSLAHLKARGPVYDEWGELASVYLPAKEYDEAIPSLRRATTRCTVMPESLWPFAPTTFWWLGHHRMLGEALEAKGDKAGACAAYAVVMDRWKDAKPRSITREKSRARAKALGCTAEPH